MAANSKKPNITHVSPRMMIEKHKKRLQRKKDKLQNTNKKPKGLMLCLTIWKTMTI